MGDAGEASTTSAEGLHSARGEDGGESEVRDKGPSAEDLGKSVEADRGKNVDSADQRAEGSSSSSDQEPSTSGGIGTGKDSTPGSSPAADGAFRGFIPVPGWENWPFGPPPQGAPGFDFGASPLIPVLIPAPFPAFYPNAGGQDQQLQPPGIFAIPVMPMFGQTGNAPPGGFFPMPFNMPPMPPPVQVDGQTQEAAPPASSPAEPWGAVPQAEMRNVAAPDGLRQRHVSAAAAAAAAPPGAARGLQEELRPGEPQRAQQQVVRRFQVGFQLDLLLILKLAVVVIVFNQDGTKDRLFLLLVLAGIVYLYQTGALAPLLRWISISAQRAMMPPPPQAPPAGDGVPPADGAGVPGHNHRDAGVGHEPGQENAARVGTPNGPEGQREGPPGGEDEQQRVDQRPQNNPNWWGIFKEVQMIVVGFLTSLLPGFQHVE